MSNRSSQGPRRWLVALLALIGLSVANPVTARDRQLDIQGLLVKDELTAKKIERRVLKSGIKDAHRYRILSGLYVLRSPSQAFWDDTIAPALEDAMEADRPVEQLRGTLLGMEEYLVAGPDDAGVRLTWESPGGRGQGFVNFVAPVVLGPDPNLTSHIAPNKIRVVSGWFVDEADDDVEIEAVGLKSRPDSWTGGDVRMPKLNSLPDRGEGAWVKYKGRSVDEGGDEMEKAIRSVERLSERDYIAADRALAWPRESSEYVKDVLTSARYRTRIPDLDPGELLKKLRGQEVEDWDWETKKLKHPTRFGISTLGVNAETEDGDEVGEVFAFVYFYTPLMVKFEEAHLYVGTSPEFFATAVQKGELPFFDREGEARFYLGHLDRWISGKALENEEKAISRRIIERTAERWTRGMNGNDARAVQGLSKNPNHWPLRVVENDDDESERPFKVMAYKDDLVSWWRRFESSLRPEGLEWFDAVYTLDYSGEATSVDLGVLFGGETRELELEVAVASVEDNARKEKLAARESEGLSDKERQRIEEERRKEDAARAAADKERAEEKRLAEERRRKEEDRLAAEEAKREAARLAQANAPIDVRLLDVMVGARAEGKPYLATRAGKSVQIKVKYDVEGKAEGHKVQVVAQAYDRSGNPIKDFAVKSTSKTPSVGENETTTWLKVPSSYTSAAQLGSYRVLTSLELDGVPLRGEREEFVHLGNALDLKRIELDPSVVLPGEEAVLLMDLQVGGWSVEDDVPLDVKVDYSVEGTTKSDSFTMTRAIGFHELEVDLDVPDGLPPGDGAYTVTVSNASGVKASSKGTLRVFAKEIVQEEDDGGGRRGRRRRVDVDENDELAALVGDIDEDDGRDVVRRDDEEDEDDMFDFDAEDEADELEEEESRREEERQAKKERQRRERDEEERKQAEADKRRKAEEADKRRKAEEADKRRKAEEADKRRKAEEDDKRRKEEERREAEREERDAEEDLDLDEEDLDFDSEDSDEEDEPPPPKKKESEPVAEFDWDNLPETVFFEDEEEEVMMWAEADGVGIVRIYGEYSLDRMGEFYGAFEKAYGDGAPEWLWVCYEGNQKPHLKFSRYSTKEDAWVTVHVTPSKFGSRDEKKQALDLIKAVFSGFVPERKKKVPFGKL